MRHLASLGLLSLLALVAPVFAGLGTRAVAPEMADVLSPVYFAPGSTRLQPRDVKSLEKHLEWVRGDRRRVLVIEGHTDEPGDSAFSQAVGAQRAHAVQAYLVSNGVSADRITAVSRGGGQPACTEPTAACRTLNRRASIRPGIRP